jgi:hypothetical protein
MAKIIAFLLKENQPGPSCRPWLVWQDGPAAFGMVFGCGGFITSPPVVYATDFQRKHGIFKALTGTSHHVSMTNSPLRESIFLPVCFRFFLFIQAQK